MKPSNDILEELSALRRADAEVREASVPLAEMMRRAADAPAVRDFAAAFAGEGVHVIAELKRASPSEGMIREEFRPVELAHELEDVLAEALLVCGGVAKLVDAVVDRTAQMLDERAVEALVDIGDPEVLVHGETCLAHDVSVLSMGSLPPIMRAEQSTRARRGAARRTSPNKRDFYGTSTIE